MDFLSIKKDFCHMPLSCVQKCKLLFCESQYSWSCVCVCFSERFYSAPSHFLFINVFFLCSTKKAYEMVVVMCWQNSLILPEYIKWLLCSFFQNTMELKHGSTLDNFLLCSQDLCIGLCNKKEVILKQVKVVSERNQKIFSV